MVIGYIVSHQKFRLGDTLLNSWSSTSISAGRAVRIQATSRRGRYSGYVEEEAATRTRTTTGRRKLGGTCPRETHIHTGTCNTYCVDTIARLFNASLEL